MEQTLFVVYRNYDGKKTYRAPVLIKREGHLDEDPDVKWLPIHFKHLSEKLPENNFELTYDNVKYYREQRDKQKNQPDEFIKTSDFFAVSLPRWYWESHPERNCIWVNHYIRLKNSTEFYTQPYDIRTGRK